MESIVWVGGGNACNTVGMGEDAGEVSVIFIPKLDRKIRGKQTQLVDVYIKTKIEVTEGSKGGGVTIKPITVKGVSIVKPLEGAQPGGTVSIRQSEKGEKEATHHIRFKVELESDPNKQPKHSIQAIELLKWTPTIGLPPMCTGKTVITGVIEGDI